MDPKLRLASSTMSTMDLKFCAVCGEHYNYIVKTRFRIDNSCLIATCNLHEQVAQRLTKKVVVRRMQARTARQII